MAWLWNRRRRADRLLAAGRIAKAIVLYRKEKAWDALMVAHRQQGDLQAAAEAGRQAGLYEDAAGLFEAGGFYHDAGEMWLRIDEKERAAIAFEKSGDIDAAVELYKELDDPAAAAEMLATHGRYREAGELYDRTGNAAEAAAVYKEGGMLLEAGDVLKRAGDCEAAARLYYQAGDKATAADLLREAGLAFESSDCYMEIGNHAMAGEVLEEAGWPIKAAERYATGEDSAERGAEVLSRALRAETVWDKQVRSRIVCADMSDRGDFVAIGYEMPLYQLFTDGGESVWHFKPPLGSCPACVAVSHAGLSVLGCDDKALHLIDHERNVLWSKELQDIPKLVRIDAAGERILCCTSRNRLFCFDKNGEELWDRQVKGIVCDVALSPNGKVIAIGKADGVCSFLKSGGEPAGDIRMEEWADSLSLNEDGSKCAVGIGMQGVGLYDVSKNEFLWTQKDAAPVHCVKIMPNDDVLSISDDTVILRNASGKVFCKCPMEYRLMGGRVDSGHRMAALWTAEKHLLRIDLKHCREEAAALYEKTGHLEKAAGIYETLGNHVRAAEAFKAAGDLHNAARNIEVAGSPKEAAELYESVGDYDKAAAIFEAEGEMAKAAHCFSQGGQWVRAARLCEQVNDLSHAAEFYERAGQFGKAGTLYKEVGNAPAAIDALADHLRSHPDETELWLELGILLQGAEEYDKAIECLQKATQEEDCRKPALMHLAECFVAKDLYDIAISRYKACLAEGEKPEWKNLDTFYGLGKAQHLAGNYAEAKRIYESILAIDFQYEDVRKRLKEVEALGSVFTDASRMGMNVTEPLFGAQGSNLFQNLSASTKERYVIKKQLGQGGMGTVFLAEDTRLKRSVALKVLSPHLAADAGLKTRMIQEAQAAAQIDHPNCVHVFDVGEENNQCYITMEYVTGQTVRNLIEEKGSLGAKETVDLLLQITKGLGYAHKKGITHRDIKPENIIITEDGTAKIMDFGLALAPGASRLTAPGGICGTLAYMAPEQLRGDPELTPAVDIYATGCMTYELLSGKLPFEGADMNSLKMKQDAPPLSEPCPDLPAELVEIVGKCLIRDIASRYKDGASLNQALRKLSIEP